MLPVASEHYGQQEYQLLLLDRILVALKAAVDRNVNSHCRQGFGSSESYGY